MHVRVFFFLSVKISTIDLSTCWQIEYIGLLVKSIFKLLLKFCSLAHKDNHTFMVEPPHISLS